MNIGMILVEGFSLPNYVGTQNDLRKTFLDCFKPFLYGNNNFML